MDSSLLLPWYPAIAAAVLCGFQRWRPRQLLPTITLLAAAGAILFYLAGRPYTESSPLTMIFCGGGPVVMSGLVVSTSTVKRWPWPAQWLAAFAAGVVVMVPLFAASCILAEALPIRGCFF